MSGGRTAGPTRAEIRAVARRLHPDLGGDPEAYLAALAELEERHAARTPAGSSATTSAGRKTCDVPADHPRGRARTGVRLRARRLVRRARGRLPRRIPGARRYARI